MISIFSLKIRRITIYHDLMYHSIYLCFRKCEQTTARTLEMESYASFGLVYDEVSGTFLSQDRSEHSSPIANKNEYVPMLSRMDASNLGPTKGFRSDLGPVLEDAPGYESSSVLKSQSKHSSGREKDKERDENDNGSKSSFSNNGSRGNESPNQNKNFLGTREKEERERDKDRDKGENSSTLRLPVEAPTPARVPPPSSYNNKKTVSSIPRIPGTGVSSGSAINGADSNSNSNSSSSSSSGHPGPPSNNFSEAKTPLAKHGKLYGYSSSGNGGSSTPVSGPGISTGSGSSSSQYASPVPAPPPTPLSTFTSIPITVKSDQQSMHNPIVNNNNNNYNNSSSSSSSSSSGYKGSNIQNTPLSPGPVPSNPIKQQRGYLDYPNETELEYDKNKIPTITNKKKSNLMNNNSNNVNDKDMLQDGLKSFLGCYQVPDAVWTKGLELSVDSLLMNSSDSQVSYHIMLLTD